jgi:DNA-binding MarR family transcriptional regulator
MRSRYEQFTSVISGIYRYIQKIERDEMVKFGLKGSFAEYLIAIARYEDGVTASVLSEICEKDKAAVSRVITEMEEKGVVYRELTGESRYRAKIRLTDRGKAAAHHIRDRARIAVEIAGGDLDSETRKIFYAALGQIAANLQSLSREGLPE